MIIFLEDVGDSALWPRVDALLALHAEFARDPRRPPLHEAQWKAALVKALLARSRVAAIWAWVIQEDSSAR
jgi:hypothetical protein